MDNHNYEKYEQSKVITEVNGYWLGCLAETVGKYSLQNA